MTHDKTTPSAPEMSWFAWGDPERAEALDPALRDLIVQALHADVSPIPPVEEADVDLPPSHLSDRLRELLAGIVGTDHVLTGDAVRLRRSGGKSTPDLLRRRSGQADPAPDAVVRPADHEQVQRLVELCSSEGVAVVPFGGGTSVVGGVDRKSVV